MGNTVPSNGALPLLVLVDVNLDVRVFDYDYEHGHEHEHEKARSRFMLPKRRTHPDLLCCLTVFAVAVAIRCFFHFHKFDDAFITFRYCLNLVEGKGFVYNAGERVLGTTTPLFTTLLAALGWIGHTRDFPLLADWVNRLADGGTAVLLYWIGRRLWRSRVLACFAGLYFALGFHSVFYASTGMETSFFSFLVLFSLERALARRHRAALALAALALLTRPDALMLWAALAAYFVVAARRRFRAADLLPAAAILVPALAALYLYFGSVIPHSVIAKNLMYGAGKSLIGGDMPNLYEVRMFWSAFLTRTHFQDYYYNLYLLIPMLLIFVIGSVEIELRSRRMLLLPLFGLMFNFAYAKAGGFLFPWYVIPTIPYLSLTVCAGIKLAGERLGRALKIPPLRSTIAICGVMLVMQALAFINGPGSIPSPIQRVMYPAHIEALYREALKWVKPEMEKFSIMAPEIGFIGFLRPEARIIDPIGLTNPEVTDYYRRHREENPYYMQYVTRRITHEFRPDYIIVLEAFKRPGLDLEADFLKEYQRIEVPLDPEKFQNLEPVFLYKRRAVAGAR